MTPKDLRWLWFSFLVSGLALAWYWVLSANDRWAVPSGYERWPWFFSIWEITAAFAAFVAVAVGMVTAIAMVVGARRRMLWPALPLTLVVAGAVAVPLIAVHDLEMVGSSLHATSSLPVTYVILAVLLTGGVGLWRVTSAQRRRAEAELAAVEQEIARRQGDLTG